MTALRFILTVLFIAASSATKAETAKLVVWQGFKFSEVTLLKENVAEFARNWNARNAGQVEITIAQVPFNDMINKLKSAALARRMPDIAFVDANSMVPLAYGGVALPLDTLPNFEKGGIDALRAGYVPGGFETNVVKLKGRRHLFGLPAQTSTLALFWNRRMFREKEKELAQAGLDASRPPADWNEFITYGKILTDPARGVYAFGMNNSLWFTMPFFNQYGIEFIRRAEDGALVTGFVTDRAEAALKRKTDLWLKHRIEGGAWREGSLDPDQGFLNNKYAMILSGPWMIENFRSSGLDFGVALIPAVPLAEAKSLGLVSDGASSGTMQHLSAGNVGGQNIVVSSVTKHPEVAYEFARYFSSEAVQRQWAEKLGQIPVNLAAQKNLDLSAFPEITTFILQANLAKPLPAIPFGSVLETEIFNPEMNLVLQGRQSPRQALQKAAAAMQRRILDPVNQAEQAAASASE